MRITIRILILAIAICFALPLYSAEDEKPKNIKILKDLSHGDLIATMMFIRTSLGVRCDFCHVMTDTKRDMASDEKKTKLIARKMISMVLDLNRNNFDNRLEVSCYTCHQGHAKPVSIPSLPLPQTPVQSASFVAADALTSPPSPADIIQKYMQALGTKEALKAAQNAKTTVWKATREGADGKPGSAEVYQEKPGKIALITDSAQGPVIQTFNGRTGWIKDSEGVREMDSGDVDRVQSAMTPYETVQFGPSTSLELRGKDTVAEHDAFVLQGKLDEKRNVRLYFDANNGLLLRKVTLQRTPVGIIPQEYDFEDYREWNGVKVPYTIHVVAADPRGNATVKISDIQINIPIDASKFEKP